jgi:hypothetical protein
VLDIEQQACHQTGRFLALVGALQFEVRKESSGILLQTEKLAGQPLVDVIVRCRQERQDLDAGLKRSRAGIIGETPACISAS